MEIIVSLKDYNNTKSDEFCFGLKNVTTLPQELNSFKQKENQIYEISSEIKKNILFISKHLKKNLGACLIIDYGKNNNIGNTLQ